MTTIAAIRPWPCAATCDAPGCLQTVSYVVRFSDYETPGLGTLYLCHEHTEETAANYERAEASS